jgi:outer membrane protein OmpA-like peptidoglycan-associated protein
MNYRDLSKMMTLLIGGLSMAACSEQPPNAALQQANSSYAQASSDPSVTRFGAYPLAEAQENLTISRNAYGNRESSETVTHYANLAQTQTDIANTVAKRRSLQAETGNVGREITLGDMLFKVGKADLNAQGQKAVGELATFLKNNPDRNVTLIGHTDSTGSAKFNNKLSRERAESVKTALVSNGIPNDRIAASGRGEADPVASNSTAQGRQKNRRVVVDLTGPGGAGVGSTSPSH